MNVLNNVLNANSQINIQKGHNVRENFAGNKVDTFEMKKQKLSESLKTVRYDKENNYQLLEGEINNQNARVEVLHDDSGKRYYKASIDNKDLNIIGYSNNFTGTYNGKEVNLSFKNIELNKDKNFFRKIIYKIGGIKDYGYSPTNSKFTIEGNVGSQPVCISIPNGDTPKDSDVNDVLITLLSGDGVTPFEMNGKIIKLISNSDGAIYKEQIDTERKNVQRNISSPIKNLLSKALDIVLTTLGGLALIKLSSKFPFLKKFVDIFMPKQ